MKLEIVVGLGALVGSAGLACGQSGNATAGARAMWTDFRPVGRDRILDLQTAPDSGYTWMVRATASSQSPGPMLPIGCGRIGASVYDPATVWLLDPEAEFSRVWIFDVGGAEPFASVPVVAIPDDEERTASVLDVEYSTVIEQIAMGMN